MIVCVFWCVECIISVHAIHCASMHASYVLCVSPFLAAVVCDPPCDNGVCVANDTCQCPSGYSGPTCSQPGTYVYLCTVAHYHWWDPCVQCSKHPC